MFWRMVRRTLFRQRGKMLMIAVTVALGASLATAMINVMLDVGDKVNQELKAYGANITVSPRGASLLDDLYGVEDGAGVNNQFLQEDELGKLKTIFWAYNIVDFAPYLSSSATLNGSDSTVKLMGTWFDNTMNLPTGEVVQTGMIRLKSWWDLDGSWPQDTESDCAMVGSLIAGRNGIKTGDTITVTVGENTKTLQVKAVFNAGGDEDECIYVPLHTAQALSGNEGKVSSIEVSALTTPDNELSRRAAINPNRLSVADYETWYCTAYVSSICYQIEEVISDSVAKAVRQVAESEGSILEKTQLLMTLVTILSLIGVALGISNLVTASVMERSAEIGLLKALGAKNWAVSLLVLSAIMITAIFGGAVGYVVGLGFAQMIGQTVFGSAINIRLMSIPLVALLVVIVTLIGSISSIRYLLSLRPAEVLHGR